MCGVPNEAVVRIRSCPSTHHGSTLHSPKRYLSAVQHAASSARGLLLRIRSVSRNVQLNTPVSYVHPKRGNGASALASGWPMPPAPSSYRQGILAPDRVWSRERSRPLRRINHRSASRRSLAARQDNAQLPRALQLSHQVECGANGPLPVGSVHEECDCAVGQRAIE